MANQIAKNLRDAIWKELGYRASAGISFNKTLAKIAGSQNKPNAQTCVPLRYIKYGMGKMAIAKVRQCGGKIAENLASFEIYKMADIQEKTVVEIRDMAEETQARAEWLKAISLGICTEEVAEKSMPNTATGIKTFNRVTKFEELEKFIRLCVMDVNQKIAMFMEDSAIFPTQFIISYRDNYDNNKNKSTRFPMVGYGDYIKDKSLFLTKALVHYK